MKKIIVTAAFLTISLAIPAQAEIYKTVDEHGNTVFTDSPANRETSEVVELSTPTTFEPVTYSAPPTNQTKQDKTEFTYKSLKINTPAHNSTVRNSGNFSVTVKVAPTLASDHKIVLKLDGTMMGKPQRSLSFQLENVDRGTHALSVEIINSKGKMIKQASNTIHVHRTIFKPPQTPPPATPAQPSAP